MPIIGLSEKRRLPRLGKIHLGVKDVNAKGVEYPKAVDYFVVPEEVAEVYGEKPTELDIVIPTEDPAIFFPQFYKQYSNKRGLVCKGDGSTANRVGEDGEMIEITCNPDTCEFYLKDDCKPVGNLLFVLPKVKGFGVYQVDTSSWNNIINLNSEIALLKNLLGRISGIPLKLTREVQKVQQKGAIRNIALIHIRSPYSLTELQNSKKALGEESIFYLSKNGRGEAKLLQKKVMYIDTGSFTTYENSYAEKQMLGPNHTGAVRIRMSGSRKDLHVSY